MTIEPQTTAESASPRTILLLGYWPPTDVGVAGRPGMLADWRIARQETRAGKTYRVVALSPRFDEPLGADPRDETWPFWGTGQSDGGSCMVDYHDTAERFWSLMAAVRPIAILSFSRWKFTREWWLDAWATNWAHDDWTTELRYRRDGQEHTARWAPPCIGGTAHDPAPPSWGLPPERGGPPDPTRPAASHADLFPDVRARRFGNLPMEPIVATLRQAFYADRLQPGINDQLGPGAFVSNFLAYHVAWYREWWTEQQPPEDEACLFAGHTHVGGLVEVDTARQAVDLQLTELFRVLPATE
jgi:hypothetical protein